MKWKAILIGLIAYLVLLVCWFFLSPQYEHRAADNYSIAMSAFYILMPLFSGFITAHFAKVKGLLHGLFLGIILTLFSMIIWYVLGILSINMLSTIVGIIILATIGGGLSQGLNHLLAKK